MNLGGIIALNNYNGTFNVVFAGGTVNVTGNASFDVTSAQVSGPVTFNVAEGKTLNTTSLVIGSDGVLTKTGPGYIAFPATAQAVTVSAGGVAVDSGTYDLSAVTFNAGTTVHLATFGGTINQGGYPASLTANATFTADLSAATSGTTIFNSDDAALLGKIKTDLATAVPQGLELTVSGTQLMLETATSDADTFTVTGNITEGTGWGGTVPGAGANVAISGEGVVGTLPSGASFPAWSSIEVKNGATLRIEATATLPPITLNKNARLEIGNNATVTLANASDLSGVVNVLGDAITIPVLSIESGATLNVPGGMNFANVNILLNGTLNRTSGGTLTFGYAAAGETTYIGFKANGATIPNITMSNYDLARIGFCCPEAGGTVHAIDALELKNMANGTNLPSHGDNYWNGLSVGVNNPTSEAFELVFDNTTWSVNGWILISGGATFRLKNGSIMQNGERYNQYKRKMDITGAGQVVVGSGCSFLVNAMGDWGSVLSTVSADANAHTAIVVEEGGVYENYRTTGNGNASVSFSNGVFQVCLPSINHETYVNSNIPFDGFGSVAIATNSYLTISTRNGDQFTDASGERVVTLANVPITGAGSIALDNANVNKFGVIVTCGSNTATGTASVVAPAEGEGETTLYFADGANWTGTVTAGNVALTNLVDAAAAASTNTFNKLDLAAGTTFPIRVWKTGGVIVAHDGLNVGSYENHGGALSVEVNGTDAVLGDGFILGTIGDNSQLPAVARPWSAKREGNFLKLRMIGGLSVIFK